MLMEDERGHRVAERLKNCFRLTEYLLDGQWENKNVWALKWRSGYHLPARVGAFWLEHAKAAKCSTACFDILHNSRKTEAIQNWKRNALDVSHREGLIPEAEIPACTNFRGGAVNARSNQQLYIRSNLDFTCISKGWYPIYEADKRPGTRPLNSFGPTETLLCPPSEAVQGNVLSQKEILKIWSAL